MLSDTVVLLEATNLQTTHLKAKLAPRRYGPFKVIWASPTNCKLQLPETMRVHPVFHNSLLKPYHKTQSTWTQFQATPSRNRWRRRRTLQNQQDPCSTSHEKSQEHPVLHPLERLHRRRQFMDSSWRTNPHQRTTHGIPRP